MAITVYSVEDAWARAKEILPAEFKKDERASETAGYPIYRSTTEYYDYVCDLTARLEVNIRKGNKTVNIYIEESAEVVELNKTVEELKERIFKLEKELEKEQEWEPFIDPHNVSQADYDSLQKSGRKMTDIEAIEYICSEFGFDKSKIIILHTVKKYMINRHSQLKVVGTYDRTPLYDATDWNYIRFDCAGWYYEVKNGSLQKFYQ